MAEQQPKFQIERTRSFRASELDEQEARTVSHIEETGCSVLHIKDGGEDRPQWSYTVGVYDTCGQPEIISIGLAEKTGHILLNTAARALRAGTDLSVGRQREMVGEVECEFRPVDPKWTKHLMGSANWYYGGDEFPVLQAVYPDRENRFPKDPDFNTYFQQPLLQPDAPMTIIEEDFWASADPSSSLFDWKFPDPPILVSSFQKPYTPARKMSRMSPMTWMMELGSFLVTPCRAIRSQSSLASIIRLTKILRWKKWLTCLLVGGLKGQRSANPGFAHNIIQKQPKRKDSSGLAPRQTTSPYAKLSN